MSKSNEKEKTVSEKTEVTEKEETTEEKVKIETPLEIAERVAAEYKDMALRARAEFENYRKNNLNLVKETRERVIAEVLEELLPVLDSFERAEGAIKDEKTLEGIAIIKEQLQSVLKCYDVTLIDAVDKPFDPKYHNCVMNVEKPEKIGIVVFEAQKGYMIKDKVLRHSVVAVGAEANKCENA